MAQAMAQVMAQAIPGLDRRWRFSMSTPPLALFLLCDPLRSEHLLRPIARAPS